MAKLRLERLVAGSAGITQKAELDGEIRVRFVINVASHQFPPASGHVGQAQNIRFGKTVLNGCVPLLRPGQHMVGTNYNEK